MRTLTALRKFLAAFKTAQNGTGAAQRYALLQRHPRPSQFQLQCQLASEGRRNRAGAVVVMAAGECHFRPLASRASARAGHEVEHPSAGRQNHGGFGGEALLDSAPQAIFFAF